MTRSAPLVWALTVLLFLGLTNCLASSPHTLTAQDAPDATAPPTDRSLLQQFPLTGPPGLPAVVPPRPPPERPLRELLLDLEVGVQQNLAQTDSSAWLLQALSSLLLGSPTALSTAVFSATATPNSEVAPSLDQDSSFSSVLSASSVSRGLSPEARDEMAARPAEIDKQPVPAHHCVFPADSQTCGLLRPDSQLKDGLYVLALRGQSSPSQPEDHLLAFLVWQDTMSPALERWVTVLSACDLQFRARIDELSEASFLEGLRAFLAAAGTASRLPDSKDLGFLCPQRWGSKADEVVELLLRGPFLIEGAPRHALQHNIIPLSATDLTSLAYATRLGHAVKAFGEKESQLLCLEVLPDDQEAIIGHQTACVRTHDKLIVSIPWPRAQQSAEKQPPYVSPPSSVEGLRA